MVFSLRCKEEMGCFHQKEEYLLAAKALKILITTRSLLSLNSVHPETPDEN
jgi:hypothetical protein